MTEIYEMEPSRSGQVVLGMDTSNGLFALTMTETGGAGLVRGNQEDGYYLAINPGDVWNITLMLDPKLGWEFESPAISFKNPADAAYYRILSFNPKVVVMRGASTYAKPIPEPWPVVKHPFNLHLRVKQSATKSYGLIIDPDLENPPGDKN